jgi:hypothetical protein
MHLVSFGHTPRGQPAQKVATAALVSVPSPRTGAANIEIGRQFRRPRAVRFAAGHAR